MDPEAIGRAKRDSKRQIAIIILGIDNTIQKRCDCRIAPRIKNLRSVALPSFMGIH